MKGKKNILATIFYRTGLLSMFDFMGDNQYIIINYHRIRSMEQHYTLFDDEVFGPDNKEFEQEIEWLTKNSDILSETDLISVMRSEYLPPKRAVVITFDDGYIDNYTLAYPVLRKYNAPAIFFIPTKSIEDRLLGWWDCFAYMIKASKKDEIVFEGRRLLPKLDTQRAMQYVLSFVYNNRREIPDLLKSLSRACEVDLPNMKIQSNELMTWAQLKEMSSNNISIGAHSHSHRVLSSLCLKEQEEEITLSKQIIEQRIGNIVRTMSYPVGDYRHFSEETKQLVSKAGYELAFSFRTGLYTHTAFDPMDVKRISVSSYFPRFVCSIIMPRFFCDFAEQRA